MKENKWDFTINLKDYNHLFYVSFGIDGGLRLGQVDRYSDEAKDTAKRGFLRVCDAILPNVVHEFHPKTLKKVSSEANFKYLDKAMKAAQKQSDTIKGFKEGKLFSTPVADGNAWYIVTKITQKTATVEWRGFCPDRRTDAVLGWGGTLPRSVIERLVTTMDLY